ncbi:MAG: AAA family ATPase [Acidimicrobiales bacterium]
MGKVVGRDAELLAATKFLDGLPDGPAATIVAGAAGIGKSTVWRHALEAAAERGYHVLSCRPVESETKLSYATLTDLIGPVAPQVFADLPGPQRHALEVLLLMRASEGARPDQRSISMALLSVLDVLTGSRPVIIGIDDVRWIDQPSACVLRFVLRRLARRPVGIVLCMRTGEDSELPLGLDDALEPRAVHRMLLQPLSIGALYQAIVGQLGISLPRPMLVRLHGASEGNPLFGVELARAVQEAGPLPPGAPLPMPASLGKLIAARIESLPRTTRRSLLVASAASAPTVEQVLKLSGGRTWDEAGGSNAEAAGVIEVDGERIRFCHPLLASAAYAAASHGERREVHAGLAAMSDDPEEHAIHRGLAAGEPDECAAETVAAGALWAWQRGAPERAAELAEMAVGLTPEGSKYLYRRRIDAAGYLVEAGDATRARTLLEQAVASEPAASERAEALWRLANIHHDHDDRKVAVELFGRALSEPDVGDVLLAAIERDLAMATIMQGDLPQAAVHARTAVELARRGGDPILVGETTTTLLLTEFLVGEHRPGELAAKVSAGQDAPTGAPLGFRSGGVVASLLKWTDDLEAARAQFDEEYRWARGRGADTHLPTLLWQMSELERMAGNWALAATHAEEAVETALLTTNDYMLSVALSVRGRISACLGRVADSRHDLEEGVHVAKKTAAPLGVVRNRAALGFLELSLGDPEAAHEQLGPLTEMTRSMGMAEPALLGHVPDDVEALIALGRLREAGDLLGWYDERATTSGRASALAAAGRCRAILLAADGRFAEAIASVDRARCAYEALGVPLALGRTLLVQGRILRRGKEKRLATRSLEEASAVLARLPAPLWMAKVNTELGRLQPPTSAEAALTPTEVRVARLAAVGRTNREIAHELFISPKSVEAHLSRIYAKLGIRSRVQLGATLTTHPPPPTSVEA